MNTLIVYASKHGCTEQCANRLAGKIPGKVTVLSVKDGQSLDLAPYDNIIVGASVYMGKIQPEIKAFCQQHLAILLQKKTGLFLASAFQALGEFKDNFPGELLAGCAATANFGYEFHPEKFSLPEKLIAKMVPKNNLASAGIQSDRIDDFVRRMQL